MSHLLFTVVAAAWLGLLSHADVSVLASDSALRYTGRFDRKDISAPRFDMNGCEIQFRVDGATNVTVHLSQRITPQTSSQGLRQPSVARQLRPWTNPWWSQPDNFMVYVDGKPQLVSPAGSRCTYCTFDTVGAKNESMVSYIAAANLTSGPHDIRIVKATEPEWNDESPSPNWLTFHGLSLDAGKVMAPSLQRPTRRIEFIGDSITAGFCNLCGAPHVGVAERLGSGTSSGDETFTLAWPFRMCEALGAECHTTAWSGMGLVHNCCGGDIQMPEVWGRTVATDAKSQWDFSAWMPHALVINLGTNDGDFGTHPEFVEAYKKLVHGAARSYGSGLEVFLACGPMSEKYCTSVSNVIENATALGIKAHFLDQRGFLNGTFGPACCGHPSAKVDGALAESGAQAISKVLGWDILV